MQFLVDANLPPALARWIDQQGHVGRHIADTGDQMRPDASIWAEAIASDAVIVSKDEDFARRRACRKLDRRLSGCDLETLGAQPSLHIWLPFGRT